MNLIYTDCPACQGSDHGCPACDATGYVIAPDARADMEAGAAALGWDVESFASLVALWIDCEAAAGATP